MSFAEDIVDKYENLDGQLNNRSRLLQDALSQSQSMHDNLNDLMNWLDGTEKDVHKMDKGTVVVVKKAPMQEQMQQGDVSR